MALHSLSLTLTQGRPLLCQTKIWWQRCFPLPHRVQLSRASTTAAPLVLKSSQFAHLFEEGPTEAIYRGTPLERLSPCAQGKLAETWVRRVLQEQNPESVILDPEPGIDCNGNRRSLLQAPYDFRMNGRRVEVKSARLTWHVRKRWQLRFHNVKLSVAKRHSALFDDLYLVAWSPQGLSLVKHDLCTGLTTAGQRTESQGHVVEVRSGVSDVSWQEALARMLKTLCEKGTCALVATETFSSLFKETLAAEESKFTPADMLFLCRSTNNAHVPKRGFQMQAMGQEIDQMLNPFKKVTCFWKTGTAHADWLRDETRVELKSSGFRFQRSRRRFICSFQGIKPDLFDELWLAVRSPLGVFFYKAQSLQALVPRVGTDHGGLVKTIYGPRNEADSLKALEVIRAKMTLKGCELIAVVQWDHEDSYEDHVLNQLQAETTS